MAEEQILEIQGMKQEEADTLYKRIVGNHEEFYEKGSTILDCGSGVGAFSLPTAVRLEARAVYAFEGYHESFEHLLNNRNNNSADTVVPDDHHILGSTGREIMGVLSGVTNALGLGEKHLVETRSIDDLWLPKVDYIRITIPGGAASVIAGGIGRIRKEGPRIVVEITSNRERHDVLELLEPLGYSSVGEEEFRELEKRGTRLLFLRKD